MSDENIKKAEELTCDIVHDLLPLYHDGVISEDTRKQVEEHLAGCKLCSDKLMKLYKKMPDAKLAPDSSKRFVSMVKKNKKKRRLIFACSFIAGMAAVCTGLYMFLHNAFVFRYDPDSFDVHYVEHYRFEDCPYSKNVRGMHDENDDHALFLYMRAPFVKNFTLERENGNIEMVYTHPALNKDIYAAGDRDDVFIIPVHAGDKTFSINGRKICDIGEPKTGEDIPEMIKAYHYFNEFNENDGASMNIADPGSENYPSIEFITDGDPEQRISWDANGNKIEDTINGNKPYSDLK